MNDRLLAVIGGVLLLVAVGQAAPGNGLNGRIVGGQDAAKAQFPHQVSLRERGSHICGASIISRNWVLTAAHCVSYFDSDNNVVIRLSDYTIRAGSNDRLSGGIVVKVVQVEVHREYGNFLNDVAVLCVESPFIYSASIQPIALPTKNTPDNAEIIVSGWGRLRQGGDIPRYLQWTTLTSLSMQECENAIQYGYPNILCLQHEADNGVCNGDSGGPALYNNEVVGIAGFVYDACGTSNPDGYARVYEFVDWIKAHTDVD